MTWRKIRLEKIFIYLFYNSFVSIILGLKVFFVDVKIFCSTGFPNRKEINEMIELMQHINAKTNFECDKNYIGNEF